MYEEYWQRDESAKTSKTDAMSVLVDAAIEHQIVYGRQLAIIPELVPTMQEMSEAFFLMFREGTELDYGCRVEVLDRMCCYLFAKGLESVVLWGASPDGLISIEVDTQLADPVIDKSIPEELHPSILGPGGYGRVLFSAFWIWLAGEEERGKNNFDRMDEIRKALKWVPLIGMTYAYTRQYEALLRRAL